MTLYQDKIKELGLPKYGGGKQIHYVITLLLKGYKVDTRQCRYIGIANLHSIIPKLFSIHRLEVTKELKRVIDPQIKIVPDRPVDVIWMTESQRAEYFKRKKAQTKTHVQRGIGKG